MTVRKKEESVTFFSRTRRPHPDRSVSPPQRVTSLEKRRKRKSGHPADVHPSLNLPSSPVKYFTPIEKMAAPSSIPTTSSSLLLPIATIENDLQPYRCPSFPFARVVQRKRKEDDKEEVYEEEDEFMEAAGWRRRSTTTTTTTAVSGVETMHPSEEEEEKVEHHSVQYLPPTSLLPPPLGVIPPLRHTQSREGRASSGCRFPAAGEGGEEGVVATATSRSIQFQNGGDGKRGARQRRSRRKKRSTSASDSSSRSSSPSSKGNQRRGYGTMTLPHENTGYSNIFHPVGGGSRAYRVPLTPPPSPVRAVAAAGVPTVTATAGQMSTTNRKINAFHRGGDFPNIQFNSQNTTIAPSSVGDALPIERMMMMRRHEGGMNSMAIIAGEGGGNGGGKPSSSGQQGVRMTASGTDPSSYFSSSSSSLSLPLPPPPLLVPPSVSSPSSTQTPPPLPLLPPTHFGPQANPQTAMNGFIALILDGLAFVLYMIWLLVPEDMLHRLHLSYYPDKYWAFAIPALLTMLGAFYFYVSCCLVLFTTHPLEDARCVTDIDTRKDTELNCGALTQTAGSVAPWADIPVPVASTILFQPWME